MMKKQTMWVFNEHHKNGKMFLNVKRKNADNIQQKNYYY